MAFLDFAAIKDRIPIEEAAKRLDLDLFSSNDQLRGRCPACKAGGKRALVITPSKHAFYCFGGHTGGDVIALVAHINGISMKEAAAYLVGDAGTDSSSNSSPEERVRGEGRAQSTISPLTYLEPEHQSVQALGLDPETLATFGAGYAPKGIMRGRLAVPIHDWRTGDLVAYGGYALKGEKVTWIYPKGLEPIEHLFFLPSSDFSELTLMHDPIEVMMGHQHGVEGGIAFLTELPNSDQLELLAAFMRHRNLETVNL